MLEFQRGVKMINIESCKKEFINYTEKFDLKNENIKRKQLHSLRVMKIANEIAKTINLKTEEQDVATLIGLLHDIGRFEQFEKYGTFRDKESIDHGDLGVKILKENEYINKYIDEEKYINLILLAIKNHNKYEIEENLDEKEKIFCNIIRDADKIDILYEAVEIFYSEKEIEEINNLKVKDETILKIYQKKTINRNEIKDRNKLDSLIIFFGFLFDINYRESFKIIDKEKYVNKIFKRFNFKDEYTRNKMTEMYNFVEEYIDEKIKG